MINYYYVVYIKKDNKVEIRATPFDTREEAKLFKEDADKIFKDKNMYVFSKILKRDMSKHKDQFWL